MNRQLILPTFAIVLTAAASFGLTALAQSNGGWVGATAAPPGNNAYAPLDTSSNLNTKAGPLTVTGTLTATNSFSASNNSVTANSGVLSTVNGAVLNTGGAATGLVVNNNENITGLLGTRNEDATVYPNGWGGGIHTWDVYAEGSIGLGQNKALNVDLNNAGMIWSNGTIGAGAGNPGTNTAYLNANGQVSAQQYCFNGGNCITSWPSAPTQQCNQDGFIYSVPDPYMNDWGNSNLGDTLDLYCRNHLVRMCLSGEACPWRGAIQSDDADTCSPSGLNSTGPGGNDIMAQVWGDKWYPPGATNMTDANTAQDYYCVNSQISFTPGSNASNPTPSGGDKCGGGGGRVCP